MAANRDTDWAYAAGFVDGEGCIAITRSFVQSRELWNGWVVAGSQAGGLAQQSWHWRSPSGTRLEPFLRGIRPWLRIKGRQAENALEMIEVLQRSRYTLGPKLLPPKWQALQEQHYWKQRELNHRGKLEFVPQPMHSPRKINRARAADNRRSG